MNLRASLLALRWMASLTLALLLLHHQVPPFLGGAQTTFDRLHWIGAWAACLALAISNLSLHRVSQEVLRRRKNHLILFIADLVLVSAAVYLTSGTDTSGLAFFVVLLLSALSGAVTADVRASFIIGLGAGAIYLVQTHASQSSFTELLEPRILLRVPLLLIISLTSALLSRSGERSARHQVETVAAFARQLRITMSPADIAAKLSDILIRESGYRQMALYLADDDQVTLHRTGDSNLPPKIDTRTLSEPIASWFRSGHPSHPRHLAAARTLAASLGIRPDASLIVPVNFADRSLGILVAEYGHRIFDDEAQAAFLSHLAEHAASAITNARMVETAQESAIGLHSLLKMSEAVSATLRIRDILVIVEEFCLRVVGASSCSLWVERSTLAGMNGGGAAPGGEESGESSPLVPLSGEGTPLEHAAAIKVWETGTELLLNTREAIEDLVPGSPAANLMALPLRTAKEALGVLQVIDKAAAFNQRDHTLLEGLASQATIAIVNARLVEGLKERAVRITKLVDTLATEKQKLEHVLSKMEEGVVLLDHERRVVLANHAGRRLLGPHGLGTLPADARAFRDPLGVLPRLGAVLATGNPVHETVPKDERYYELSTAVVEGGEGAIAVIRDITELVRLDTMRSNFVSHVSHELRTPLAAIIGSIKLILEGRGGSLSETHDRLLRIVERESGRLMELINDLLDLAKLEAGRTLIQKVDVELGSVIAEAVESIQPLAGAKSIRLSNKSDSMGTRTTVPCDPALIRQVLHNLIGNAIKFTPKGGRVEVSARVSPRWAVVRVIDTGVGITRDKWEAVFNKFEQIGAHKGPEKGTGLGLAICRQIVERHGGRIGLVSQDGHGSNFYFTLPCGEPIVEVGGGDLEPEAGLSPLAQWWAPDGQVDERG